LISLLNYVAVIVLFSEENRRVFAVPLPDLGRARLCGGIQSAGCIFAANNSENSGGALGLPMGAADRGY
jgi:hypothetical protein